jgi:hypothetical protein
MGLLKRRCISIELGVKDKIDDFCGGVRECPAGYFCGRTNENPNYG